MNPTNTLRTPPLFERIGDVVRRCDNERFRLNPSLKSFRRLLVAGEDWPHHHPLGTVVTVWRIRDGVRMRQFNSPVAPGGTTDY